MPGRKLIFAIFVCLMVITETRAQDQNTAPKDLLGRWQSINAPEEDFLFNFVDLNHVYVIRPNGHPANNLLLSYTIDTLKDELILNIIFPNGFKLKQFLWIKNKSQIKMLGISIENYKDPMKEHPKEDHPKTIIFRKLNESKSA